MNTEIIEATVVPEVNEKLVKFAGSTGLEKSASETLIEAFRPVFLKSREALALAAGVAESVKDATCVKEIKKSRACRLAIRAVRLEGEAVHKKEKENALRFGKAVDGFKNILLADLAPVEQALQDAEDTAERAEAARLSALKSAREAEIKPFLETPPLGDLSALSEADYAALLADAKLLRQAKLDAIAKAAAEAAAKSEAERIEREHITAENARLKAEAEETARKVAAEAKRIEAERAEERRKAEAEAARLADTARKEREAIEAKARAEAQAAAREATRLKAELRAKEEAEATEKRRLEAEAKAAELAAKKLAAAPDKAKLLTFASAMQNYAAPMFSSAELSNELNVEIVRLTVWCRLRAERL